MILFLGQAPARECGCGWLNFWLSMVSSAGSQLDLGQSNTDPHSRALILYVMTVE